MPCPGPGMRRWPAGRRQRRADQAGGSSSGGGGPTKAPTAAASAAAAVQRPAWPPTLGPRRLGSAVCLEARGRIAARLSGPQRILLVLCHALRVSLQRYRQVQQVWSPPGRAGLGCSGRAPPACCVLQSLHALPACWPASRLQCNSAQTVWLADQTTRTAGALLACTLRWSKVAEQSMHVKDEAEHCKREAWSGGGRFGFQATAAS